MFSAGTVDGHEIDTMYFRIERPGIGAHVFVVVHPDEVAAMAWVLTGALWSVLHDERYTAQTGSGS